MRTRNLLLNPSIVRPYRSLLRLGFVRSSASSWASLGESRVRSSA
jgi:hypothetical protein